MKCELSVIFNLVFYRNIARKPHLGAKDGKCLYESFVFYCPVLNLLWHSFQKGIHKPNFNLLAEQRNNPNKNVP